MTEPPLPPEAPPLLDALPETTRSVLAVDVEALLSGEAADAVGALLAGRVADPALGAPFQMLARYTLGVDLAANVEEVVLAQTTRAEDGFVLVAKITVRTLDDLFAPGDLVEATPYEGHAVYERQGSDLHLSLLPDGRLVVGREAALHAVIDTADGNTRGINASAIGPYLSALDGDDPAAFVVGLPVLYGEIEDPGSGQATLRRAEAITGSAAFGRESFEGQLRIHTDNARAYVDRFNALVAETPTTPLTVGDDGAVVVEIPRTPLDQTREEVVQSRALVKQLVHSMDAVDYTESVIHGGNVPWMNFDVGGDPNSIFINFEFDDSQLEAFEQNELPEGFRLAPLRILESDEPSYFLVLNIYNSSGGLVAGARAEWSVFVQDPEDGHPRFLVVEAAAENVTADSVNLLTPPEPVSHAFEDGDIASHVAVEEDGGERHYFSSRVRWPQEPEERVSLTREFVAANDFIYWGNGVSDRTLYNASMHNRDAVRVVNGGMTLTDDSKWAPYLKPVPKHAYVYLNPLEIVISPWWNLDEAYLDVTSEHLQTLVEFKNNFYPAAVLGIAEGSVAGEGDALAAFVVGSAVPSAHYTFRIADPDGLVDALALPEGTRLAPLRVLEGEGEADHYLVLRVYSVDGMAKGNRAEWTVFVEGDDGRPEALVVALLSEEVVVDPEVLLQLPSLVDHGMSDGGLTTALRSDAVELEARIDLTSAVDGLPTLDWVETRDRTCRPIGVCDKIFYAGQTMEDPVAVVPADGVEIRRLSTPWDAFLESVPTSVFARENAEYHAWNPWRNVRVAQ